MLRQHNSKDTKELIISSAVELFIEKGYSRTTLEDIVRRVGLTRGAFYWNFETKSDILHEIVSRYEKFYLDIYDNYQHIDSVYQTLKNFLLLNLHKKNKLNPYVYILRYKVESNDELATFKDRQAAMDEKFLGIITDEIARGQRQGEFRKDKKAEFLALSLYTFLLGIDAYNMVHLSADADKFMSEETIEDLVNYLLDTLT